MHVDQLVNCQFYETIISTKTSHRITLKNKLRMRETDLVYHNLRKLIFISLAAMPGRTHAKFIGNKLNKKIPDHSILRK